MKRALLIVAALLFCAAPAMAQTATVMEYYHLDAVGSVRAVTDQSGTVIRRHDDDPFGQELPTSPTGDDTPRFTGKERDGETALDYFGARYYSSWTGRFMSVDPTQNTDAALIEPQRWNRYAYALNNPLRNIDPDGRDTWDLVTGFIKGAAQAAGSAVALPILFQLDPVGTSRAVISGTIEDLKLLGSGLRHPSGVLDAYVGLASSGNDADQQALGAALGRGAASAALFAMAAQPGTSSITSIGDVLANPLSLRGVSPEGLLSRIGQVPENWRIETLGKGSSEGQGFVLREYTANGGPTGRMIRWHPGRGHHGEEPYWRVNDYQTKSEIIR